MAGYYVNNAALRLHALCKLPKLKNLLDPATVAWLEKYMQPETVNDHGSVGVSR
jgi:hypothetical protein